MRCFGRREAVVGKNAIRRQLGAHHLSRKPQRLGHDARLMPAKYVRAYSKGQKNDFRDAEAIGGAEGGLIGGLMYVGAATAAGAIVSGGTLAAGITAAVLAGAAGGLIGSILAKWVGARHAHYLQEQMDRGGLLLWVRTWDAEDERRAVEILRKPSGATSTSTHCRRLSGANSSWVQSDAGPIIRQQTTECPERARVVSSRRLLAGSKLSLSWADLSA
jgi:hypothetical protein